MSSQSLAQLTHAHTRTHACTRVTAAESSHLRKPTKHHCHRILAGCSTKTHTVQQRFSWVPPSQPLLLASDATPAFYFLYSEGLSSSNVPLPSPAEERRITHLQLVCCPERLKAAGLRSITKTCLCLLLFVCYAHTIAFHRLRACSPPGLTMSGLLKHLGGEQRRESVAHAGGWAGATGPVPPFHCSSSSTQARDASRERHRTRKEQAEAHLPGFVCCTVRPAQEKTAEALTSGAAPSL